MCSTLLYKHITDELLAITEEQVSLDFMQQNKDRFGDRLIRERSVQVAGMPADSDLAKVRSGQVGESRQQLDVAGIAELNSVWREKITGQPGFADYAAMIVTLE